MVLKGKDAKLADLRRVQIQDSALSQILQGAGGVLDQLQSLNQTANNLLLTQANAAAVPTANLLWNGEIGHAVWTWHAITMTAYDVPQYNEAAWFFSHNRPAALRTFASTEVAIDPANTITLPDHEFTNGCAVDLLKSGGLLPAPLTTGVTYFVIYVDADTIKLASTIANAESTTAIDLTDAGTALETFTIQQILLSTDSRVSSTNNTLKTYVHTTYDPRYGRWDADNGAAQMTGTTSVDILMPSNNVDASTALARVSMIAAKASEYIELTETCRMSVGIWDNTSGQRQFLTGDIGFTATLIGATGSTTRKFVAVFTSDRGFQLISPEVTILNAPADGLLNSLNYIAMGWQQQPGQLQVDIYEYNASRAAGLEYQWIADVSSATSFIHEGGYLQTVSGYPTVETGSELTAVYTTITGTIADLATNGSAWSTVNFPCVVPQNYNKGNTTNRQWVRVWLSEAPNLWIQSGVTTDGSDTITIPDDIINTAAFASGGYESGASSLYFVLQAQVYDENDVLLLDTIIADPLSDTSLQLNDAVVAGTNRKLRIVGGGFHGVLIDKIHLGYQENTSYAPNALDSRTLMPRAAPDGSTQGGVGGGGGGGGIFDCVIGSTLIEMQDGQWVPIEECEEGSLWASDRMDPNILARLKESKKPEKVRRVRSANGCEVVCTDGEAFVTTPFDRNGTFLFRLRVGDPVLTKVDGRVVQSRITEISPYCGLELVYTPSLGHGHTFIAGEWRPAWWQKLLARLRTGTAVRGGFVLHNVKPAPTD